MVFAKDKYGNLIEGAQEMACRWKQHFKNTLNRGGEEQNVQ